MGFPYGKTLFLEVTCRFFLLSLRRRAELSAAEASGSLGDYWLPDLPDAREDFPRERREGVPWCGK